ncbi:Alpha-N-arabinofuranosidase [Geitlerinema sp. FC II]|nr:Alpha-N-arabinofuranosidase [Geitlerinema sp. FC II]
MVGGSKLAHRSCILIENWRSRFRGAMNCSPPPHTESVPDKLGFKKSSPQRHRGHREGLVGLVKTNI